MDEDSLIVKLKKSKHCVNTQLDILRKTWDEKSPMVKKAYANYKLTMRRLDKNPMEEVDFIAGYLDSCYKNAMHAAQTTPSLRKTTIKAECHTVYLCWHFRDYPFIRSFIVDNLALVLIARDADWLNDLTEADLTLNFRCGRPLSKLFRCMREGRKIVAMFDYCYGETRKFEAEFLSYQANTPIGILQLAKKFNYQIKVIGPIGMDVGEIFYIDKINDVRSAAAAINSKIGESILDRPAEWLMWPALDQRLA